MIRRLGERQGAMERGEREWRECRGWFRWRENSKSQESEENEGSQETHSLTMKAGWTGRNTGSKKPRERRFRVMKCTGHWSTEEFL